MKIRTELLADITVARFSRLREVVDLNPSYQREGGVWRTETRSRLIDTIINGLDVPKLYFEKATTRRFTPEGLTYQYAVIDGKQRLEAIISFLDGELALADDFWFFEDRTVLARGMRLRDLQNSYPLLARRFLDFMLPVVSVSADSGDLIEEMFQRLNASAALNAAEKRNAIAGPTRDAANQLAEHALLVEASPIKNARYKYRELGAKFLAIEHQLDVKQRIIGTKAQTLEELFRATRGSAPAITASQMDEYRMRANETLDRMATVFGENDPLLASIGTVVTYYIVFGHRIQRGINRGQLLQFEELRRAAAELAEDEQQYARSANARLREYNVLVQSTNDGSALTRRADIISAYISGYTDDDPLAGLDALEGDLPDGDDDCE